MKANIMKKQLLVALATLLLGATAGPLTLLAQPQRSARTTALDATAKEALITALAGPEGEYAAHAEYAAVVAKFGAVQPYANILRAEQQHITALQRQCARFGVPVPPDSYLGKVTAPDTLDAAAAAGVSAEQSNVAMYEALLAKVQNYPSLVQVFTNLRAASFNHHLPAFEAAEAGGGSGCPGMCPATGANGGCTGNQDRIRQRLHSGSGCMW